ncbi:relaxase domain-containing protein, partial [Streptomyces rubiginosohelvolus]|uniref:relaxase domain-containing protein n=1 Tax=Streptomyces rubiginosohelvolus TaxID=67362 RepID=UPI001E309D2B
MTVTGVDFVFRPQPTIYLQWALGDEETRRVIEAAHERAIVRVLEWIEDEVAVIRYGKVPVAAAPATSAPAAVRAAYVDKRVNACAGEGSGCRPGAVAYYWYKRGSSARGGGGGGGGGGA